MTAAAMALAVPYYGSIRRMLAADPPGPDPTELDPGHPAHRLALEYLQKILEGNASAAVALVSRAAKETLTPQAVYMQVLLPAQREALYERFLWALRKGAIPAGRIMSNAGALAHKPATSTIT